MIRGVRTIKMNDRSHITIAFALVALLLQGCASVTERKSVYAGPWVCGFDEHLGPLKVTVHPAAGADREPYGSHAIRGFRVVLDFQTNVLSDSSVSNITAVYVYAPPKQQYDKQEHPMSVLSAALQPGVPRRNMYSVFLQPKDHLDASGFVKEGRYKLNVSVRYEGGALALVSETNLAYEKTRAVYFTPIIYLYYLFGAGWHD
jgi:hypothetical protein